MLMLRLELLAPFDLELELHIPSLDVLLENLSNMLRRYRTLLAAKLHATLYTPAASLPLNIPQPTLTWLSNSAETSISQTLEDWKPP